MADQEPEKKAPPPGRRPRAWRIVALSLFFLLLLSFIGVFLGFYYFGERFLRNYLQEKIRISSNGIYHADFKRLQVNILTGKVVIDSFELIPDTIQYQRLKAGGRIARSLYRISFSSLTVDRVHFRQIYEGKRIGFRQLTLQRPVLRIVGFPDTLTAKRNKWRVIYEDLYPTVSYLFNDFHIDSVKVNHGLLFTSFTEKSGRQSTGEYEFSSVLKDVSVNPFSYYNRNRVFYSRDVDLVVHNFETRLADSLYLLKADEIGFSLTKSTLYGKKVSLIPNLSSRKIRQVQSGDLFRIELPAFSVRGIDLYRAMTGREVAVSSVTLTDFFIRVYRDKPSPGAAASKKGKKKITLAGLYTVVAKELRYVAIDSLCLRNGSFEYYGNPADSRPELRIGTVNIELDRFRLDSVSHRDPSRIFYSRGIELELGRFSLYLRDGIHCVNASSAIFSTRKSLIDIHEATIFPDRKKNLRLPENRRNTMFVNLPRLTFTGIDLKKVFNRRVLDFDRLIINEPEVRYTRFQPAKNPDPRFKQPEDFFSSENEDVVYDLLKKYLYVIKGSKIDINGGLAKFSVDRNGMELPLASSSFDLVMQQFLIDSVHGMNEQGYFYSHDFTLDLRSVSIVSPDSLKYMQAGRVRIATRDSLIEADNVHLYKSADPLIFNSLAKMRHPMTFEFSLNKLTLTGLNHKKLFLEKILKANEIVLDNPALYIKANARLRPAGPPEESQLLRSGEFVHSFEIGRCIVRKGAFSYDGEEDRKASYFSLKDIDFAVVGATVRIPGKGLHDGVIKFDSLHLKVFPLRAIIADSSYALEARSLEVHSYPADIMLKGIKISPLQSWKDVPGRKSLVTITIPEIQLNGFYFDRAIFDNQWLVDSLYVDHPITSVELMQDQSIAKGSGHPDPLSFIRIPPFMKTLAVNKISISHAAAGLIIHGPEKTRSRTLANIMLEVTSFRADSATRSNPAAAPLFNAGDITLSAPGFSWASPDSMYTFTVGSFGASTRLASAYLDSVSVTPNFDRTEFSVKAGHQADRNVLKIPRIKVSHVDFRKLLDERQLRASRINLEGLSFESYLDKRVLVPSPHSPLMPGRMVAGIKFAACVDTIALSNGFASYEEQTGEEPGKIFFDRMNATLTGFCTPSFPAGSGKDLDLHGTLRLMGLSALEAWIHFQKGHPRDTFTVHATIGEFDLTSINPMLSKLMPVSIKSGTATATEIIQFNANDSMAIGRMSLVYNNLTVRLHPVTPGTWPRVKQYFLTQAVNLLLADNNPGDDGKMKYGEIYFKRDPSRGFFNFVWKSVLSGIKSTVGVNTKLQKQMKKQSRTQNQ